MPYEPKIIAYLCTWCGYTGADTAGIARLKSPANNANDTAWYEMIAT